MGIMDLFKRQQVVVKQEPQLKLTPIAELMPGYTRIPAWTNWDTEAAINEGYKASAWVYACVKRRADSVASVPLVVEVKNGKEWEPAPNHPLQRLLDEPNPEMDMAELMRLTMCHLDLGGNSFWIKVRASTGVAVELWPVLPNLLDVLPGDTTLINGYKAKNGGRVYPAQDVTHLAYANPSSLYLGQSPLMAAARAVDVDNAASAWQKVSLQNRGVPDGVFSLDAELTEDQWNESRKQVREQYASTGNARAPWVMSKATYQQLSLTPVEMDYINTRRNAMLEICAAYNVPSEMISGMGDANRASGENVRKVFWLDTIVPLLNEICGMLTLSLAPDFGGRGKVRVRYDLSGVPALQEDIGEKIRNAKDLWSMGVPFNKVAERLGLGIDDIEGGDIGYLPAGLLPTDYDFSAPASIPASADASAKLAIDDAPPVQE